MNRAIFLSRLGRHEAGPYRELRLLALQMHPEAFGASFEEESSLSENDFAKRLDDGLVFGAWSAEQLVGCAGLAQREKAKLRHKAILWGMFVRHEMRGNGVGKRLLEEVLGHARTCCEEVLLTVVEGNTAAQAMYTGAGFQEYGREQGAIKLGSHYYNELMMRLPIKEL